MLISFSPPFYGDIIDIEHCINLRWTTQFDICICCKMITTIRLASIISQSSSFFFAIRTFEIYFLSNVQIFNTVLLTTLMWCTLQPQHLFILQLKVYTFWPPSPNSRPSPRKYLFQLLRKSEKLILNIEYLNIEYWIWIFWILKYSLIYEKYSFFQQTFMKHLVCARHDRHERFKWQLDKVPALKDHIV